MNWRCSDNSDAKRGGTLLVGFAAAWACSAPRAIAQRRKGLGASAFPPVQAPPPGARGKARDDSKATIPNFSMKTTENRVYAEVRTRTKSTETFYAGKSREILAVLDLLRTQKSFLYASLVKGESDISLSSTYLHSHRRRADQEQILWLENHGQEYSARGSSVAAPPHIQECLSLGEGTNTQGELWRHISWAQSAWEAQWSHITVKLSAGPSEKG